MRSRPLPPQRAFARIVVRVIRGIRHNNSPAGAILTIMDADIVQRAACAITRRRLVVRFPQVTYFAFRSRKTVDETTGKCLNGASPRNDSYGCYYSEDCGSGYRCWRMYCCPVQPTDGKSVRNEANRYIYFPEPTCPANQQDVTFCQSGKCYTKGTWCNAASEACCKGDPVEITTTTSKILLEFEHIQHVYVLRSAPAPVDAGCPNNQAPIGPCMSDPPCPDDYDCLNGKCCPSAASELLVKGEKCTQKVIAESCPNNMRSMGSCSGVCVHNGYECNKDVGQCCRKEKSVTKSVF